MHDVETVFLDYSVQNTILPRKLVLCMHSCNNVEPSTNQLVNYTGKLGFKTTLTTTKIWQLSMQSKPSQKRKQSYG